MEAVEKYVLLPGEAKPKKTPQKNDNYYFSKKESTKDMR